jgi:iron complex transport system ATP-binding protein
MKLTANDLVIGYGQQTVGRNINLDVGTGEILCLLGPNGCGKTTLFRTLLGLLKPLGGEVAIDGEPLSQLSRRQIAQRIAYVPQSHTPPFPYDAIDIVLMGRSANLGLFSQPSSSDRDNALQAMQSLGIQALAATDYTTLSAGQRQLVLIARALTQQASLIVMDEPTASLDFGNQAIVLDRIARLAQSSGQGIVLSTHDPDQAFALSANVALMKEGAIIANGPTQQTLTSDRLSEVYGIQVTVETTSSGLPVCLPSLREAHHPSNLS